MELYLTKMILNPRSRRVRFEMGNPQELHKTVCGAFPAIENQAHLPHHEWITPRNKFDVLHRLEVDYRNGKAVLLVQSTVKPDWTHLRENFLAADVEENPAVKSIGESYERIEAGINLRFRLQANPTKRVGKSDKQAADRFKPAPDAKIRRRVELIGDENETIEEKQIKWLAQKGEGAGFRLANIAIKETVENASAVGQGKIQARRNDASRPMTFGTVVYEGVLQVTDAVKLREALVKGIGSAKAYGFGLLSVAPVK